MSGSQRCKHAWLAGREVVEVSASVRRTLECSQDSVACLLSESMEIGSLYGFSGSSRDMRTAGRLNLATNRRNTKYVYEKRPARPFLEFYAAFYVLHALDPATRSMYFNRSKDPSKFHVLAPYLRLKTASHSMGPCGH